MQFLNKNEWGCVEIKNPENPPFMKRISLLFLVLMAFTACEKEDDLNPTSMSREDLLTTLTLSNGLRITEFVEDGADMTSDFNPYVFDFETNDTVTATKGSETINGTYSVFLDDGRKDLRMNFPTTSALYELSDDWYFISANETGLRFADGGDVLWFQTAGSISNPPPTPGMNQADLIATMISPNGLRITKFTEDGTDMTTLFSPYLFVFQSNGSVSASKTGEIVNGTYSVFTDDGRVELRMSFPINSALSELRDDWYFSKLNGNVLRFADAGDVLSFELQ
jgi:hypothetical protein